MYYCKRPQAIAHHPQAIFELSADIFNLPAEGQLNGSGQWLKVKLLIRMAFSNSA